MMRPVQQTAATVTEWLREGRRVAAGTLVAVDGSSPLDVGASVYIDEHGTIEGSVTGGCVESAVAQEAIAMLEQRPPAEARDLRHLRRAGRHGRADVRRDRPHLHPPDPRRRARGDAAPGWPRSSDERPAALATLLDGEHAGAKLFVEAGGSIGTLGGPALLDSNAAQEARGLTIQGRSTVRAYGEDGASLGSGLRVHVAAFAEPPRMVIFGAIDFASALAPLAKGLGYRVTIADPRRAFLDSPRFSSNAQTVAGWPQEVLADMTLGPRDAVLVFTHDPKLDVPAVVAALGTERRLHRRARQPPHDRRPQRAAARGGRRRGRARARVRAVRARHRLLDGRGDRGGDPRRDHREPGRARRARRCARAPVRSGAIAQANVAEGERRGTSTLAWQAKP